MVNLTTGRGKTNMADLPNVLEMTDEEVLRAALDLLKRVLDRIDQLRKALEEIADDPTGDSQYQADLAKEALKNDGRFLKNP